jgi:hypothetical protein
MLKKMSICNIDQLIAAVQRCRDLHSETLSRGLGARDVAPASWSARSPLPLFFGSVRLLQTKMRVRCNILDRRAVSRCCARGRCTMQIASTVGLARSSPGGALNPGRGGLFIDLPDPYSPSPFCFSAARRPSFVHETRTVLRRAAEKQKGGYYLRIVSINRPPLTGFGRSKAANGRIESLLFLSVFLNASNGARKVERGHDFVRSYGRADWAHSASVANLPNTVHFF